jgi:lipopolysaccharide/colanic/teichoic acid biosynthesis glycosyltransferase
MNSSYNNCPSHEGIEHAAKSANARNSVPSWKRFLDMFCVLITLPLWVPLGAMIGLFIRIVSPGPILFRQKRIGHLGKEFPCLKFRTMNVATDTSVHQAHWDQLMRSGQPMKKLDASGDPRLIRGGIWLRAMGVDELPQLINVLRGEMSLVGPRPCVVYEYVLLHARHRRRCETLPGLTGLWQVNGKNKTTFEKMIELDLAYVEKKSLLLDLKIIASTPSAILVQIWNTSLRSA